MPENIHFSNLLREMAELHARKSHDYAKNDNPFSNFEEAATEAGLEVNEVFRVMIGIKNARIRELEGNGKTPENEALVDSYMDRLMYGALQLAYMKKQLEEANAEDGEGKESVVSGFGHGV